jgi:hypothetical protein
MEDYLDALHQAELDDWRTQVLDQEDLSGIQRAITEASSDVLWDIGRDVLEQDPRAIIYFYVTLFTDRNLSETYIEFVKYAIGRPTQDEKFADEQRPGMLDNVLRSVLMTTPFNEDNNSYYGLFMRYAIEIHARQDRQAPEFLRVILMIDPTTVAYIKSDRIDYESLVKHAIDCAVDENANWTDGIFKAKTRSEILRYVLHGIKGDYAMYDELLKYAITKATGVNKEYILPSLFFIMATSREQYIYAIGRLFPPITGPLDDVEMEKEEKEEEEEDGGEEQDGILQTYVVDDGA